MKYHLQWNVCSTSKSNIPFISMGVLCDILHGKNNLVRVRKNLSGEYTVGLKSNEIECMAGQVATL